MLLFLGFRQNVSRETFCFLFFQLLIAKYILIYLKYDDAMGKRSESRCKLACKRIFDLLTPTSNLIFHHKIRQSSRLTPTRFVYFVHYLA